MCSGAFEKRIAEFEEVQFADPLLAELKATLVAGREQVLKAIAFVKSHNSDYLDLAGRRLVDAATAVYIGHLFLRQAEPGGSQSSPCGTGLQPVATARDRKKRVARRFIDTEVRKAHFNCELICAGDRTPLEEYDLLAGPVPARE